MENDYLRSITTMLSNEADADYYCHIDNIYEAIHIACDEGYYDENYICKGYSEIIRLKNWVKKFSDGTFDEFDIKEICETYVGLLECGALINHIVITKEDDLDKRIAELRVKIKYDHGVADFDEMPDEIINKLVKRYMYIKLGVYYIFFLSCEDL